MSYFDLSSDGKIPRDGLRKHVQTQIPTEGGALSGLIRFRWTSSQDSWFIPSLSYVMYEFEVQKTGGNVVADRQGNFVEPTIVSTPASEPFVSVCLIGYFHSVRMSEVGFVNV